MNTKDNGGAAFPSPGVVLPHSGQQGAYEGMTLRDFFAAHALLTAHHHLLEQRDGWGSIAQLAYIIADHMLEARKK